MFATLPCFRGYRRVVLIVSNKDWLTTFAVCFHRSLFSHNQGHFSWAAPASDFALQKRCHRLLGATFGDRFHPNTHHESPDYVFRVHDSMNALLWRGHSASCKSGSNTKSTTDEDRISGPSFRAFASFGLDARRSCLSVIIG